MKTINIKKISIVSVLTLFLAITAILFLRDTEPDLISKSKLIASFPPDAYAGYKWLNNDRILYISYLPKTHNQQDVLLILASLNVDTTSCKKYRLYSNNLNSTPETINFKSLSDSPTRRFRINFAIANDLRTIVSPSISNGWLVGDIEKKPKLIRQSIDYYSNPIWFHGMDRWGYINYDDQYPYIINPHIIIYRKNETKIDRSILLTGSVGDTIVGRIKDNQILTYTFNYQTLNSNPIQNEILLNVHPIDLNSTTSESHQLRIPLSRPARILDIDISPDGKKIVWRQFTNGSQPNKFIEKYLKLIFKSKFRPNISIWCGNLDGTDIHELGRYYCDDNRYKLSLDDDTQAPLPICVQWHPDNKHVTYQYQNGLYSVQE